MSVRLSRTILKMYWLDHHQTSPMEPGHAYIAPDRRSVFNLVIQDGHQGRHREFLVTTIATPPEQ